MIKKNLMTSCVTIVSALLLTACEAPLGFGKTPIPTLEEIADAFDYESQTGVFETNIYFETDIDWSVEDVSEELNLLVSLELADLDADLSELDGVMYTPASIEEEFEVYKTDKISHWVGGKISGTDSFGEKTNPPLKPEFYVNHEEKLIYSNWSGDWTVSEYSRSITFDNVIDAMVSYNENADENNQIEVKKNGDKYCVDMNFIIDNDLIVGLDGNESHIVQCIFDDLDWDIDIDELKEVCEYLDDEVEVRIPVLLELGFSDNGKKNEDRCFYISDIVLNIEMNISVLLSKTDVVNIVQSLGFEDSELYSCIVNSDFDFFLVIDSHFTPNDAEEIEIPKKVIRSATYAD